ncbi:MAG TPA: NAD-dependent epimerase/dehydratase family protein [Anaerolineales bacterium]|nr:NAD-dependent epimerase/dehydratase family protein [Anaerolineales bacterium]
MARYLVTGVAGFIGARVTELLLGAGDTVVGVDNMNTAYDVRLKEYRLKNLEGKKGFEFRRLDISNRKAVEELSEEMFAGVINLAARAGVRDSVEDPWIYLESNTAGTLNLLELCRRQGIEKFVLASTSSIYGANAPLPTPETADSSHPLQPYAASKKGAEAMCHVYHFLYGIDVTIVRYFTVYGPAGRPNMSMFRFMQCISEGKPIQLLGDGNQTRGFTYIDDIARGTILALKPVGFEIVNLGGHESISINDLIAMLEKFIGRKATVEQLPAEKADMSASWADVSKAGKLLGWEPQVGLESGIAKMVEWYKAERSWASRIKLD